MHRYVWRYFNGDIPKGYHIHHIDEDKSNNDISNLQLVKAYNHLSLYGKLHYKQNPDKMIAQMDYARQYANKWHGSLAGKEWHKQHYEEMKKTLHKKGTFQCLFCGKEFTGIINGLNKFCSGKCKAAYRRKMKLDYEVRRCEYCEKEFTVSKYAKTRFCSGSCANRARARVRTDKKDTKNR